MPLQLISGDITKMSVDVIVNAANQYLRAGGGVCRAIFNAAGRNQMQEACDAIGFCDTGQAVITPAFNLHAKAVIHTVGPIYSNGKNPDEELLSSCYLKSLELAIANGYKSIAFPLISAGIYGYPKEEAIQIAVKSILSFLRSHELSVYLALFNPHDLESAQRWMGHYNQSAPSGIE